MTGDELAASIGRSITDILDTVTTYTAEQVALAVKAHEAEQAEPPPDTTPQAARREVSNTSARTERAPTPDDATLQHGKRCGFTQPHAQNHDQ